jgi:hypothetical protein
MALSQVSVKSGQNPTGNDQGEAVKSAIHTLAEACADYLWRQFFGREAGPEFQQTTVTEIVI